MSDLELDERQLAEQLHAHDLPAKVADLARSSARRGVRLRRRRQTGMGVALAALLIVPGAIWSTGRDRTTPVPVATLAAPSQGARPATVDPGQLPLGRAPGLDYVVDNVWHRTDGSQVALTASDRADGAVSWVRYGDDHLFVSRDRAIGNDGTYSIDGGPELSFPTTGSDTAAVAYPGPDGSVLVPTDGALLILGRDGRWSRNTDFTGIPENYTVPRATKNNVWTSRPAIDRAGVIQLPSVDSDAGGKRFRQWYRVNAADPASDQVALAEISEDDCNDIVDGSTGVSRWHSCVWTFQSFSPDGRYVLATVPVGAVLLDIEGRSFVYSVPVMNAIGTYHFAADNTVSFVVTNPQDGNAEAIVSCDPTGACWRATEWSRDHTIVILDPPS